MEQVQTFATRAFATAFLETCGLNLMDKIGELGDMGFMGGILDSGYYYLMVFLYFSRKPTDLKSIFTPQSNPNPVF